MPVMRASSRLCLVSCLLAAAPDVHDAPDAPAVPAAEGAVILLGGHLHFFEPHSWGSPIASCGQRDRSPPGGQHLINSTALGINSTALGASSRTLVRALCHLDPECRAILAHLDLDFVIPSPPRAHGLPITGHLGSGYRNTANPRDAIRMGIDRVEHFPGADAMPAGRSAYASLVELDVESCAFAEIAALYVERNVHFDATLTAFGYFGAQDPGVFTTFHDEPKYLTPYMRAVLTGRPPRRSIAKFERIYWKKRETLKAFYDAGARHQVGGHLQRAPRHPGCRTSSMCAGRTAATWIACCT